MSAHCWDLWRRGRLSEARETLAQELSREAFPATPIERFTYAARRGDYRKAFAEGEKILDDGATLEAIRAFWNPWGWIPHELIREAHLSAVRELPRSPWTDYFTAALQHDVDVEPPAGERYAWMALKLGQRMILAGRFAQGERCLRQALRAVPFNWHAHGFLAEALLCRGAQDEALRELDTAVERAPLGEKPGALAWRGELKLWLGLYDKALADLDAAVLSGEPLAYCWRGACHLKLRRPQRALEDLDEGLRRLPHDEEAYLWRAEAKLSLGRREEARADLSREPASLWARVLRGLAGSDGELLAEYSRLPLDVVTRGRRECRLDVDGTPAARRKILKKLLTLSRGYRRDEYRQKVWLR